ncbi:MAG: hypothetical protein U1F56_21500 [Rubrivivax sp.]
MAGRRGAAAALQPDDVLVLPRHQRMVTQFDHDPDTGVRELRLYYGDQEISFDEPELFEFGQTLAQQSSFVAADALGWGRPGDWPRVRALLGQLLDAGVLRRGHAGEPAARLPHRGVDAGARPSPLAPARTAQARSWHELPGLMHELTGRPLEIGWLELVVPVFRVAHMALDAEGRQVGESNAFPPALRLDVPTRWRACIYAGSRHQDDKPMNVTALKAMRAHWGPMMAMLLKVREAYLERCPEARAGWTVGHLERLGTAVLALPAYQLMRRERRVDNGRLHPVLSSMFRVTDGLRMTMHHMLFIPFGEPTRKPDTPMTSAEVHAYAERAFSLHSDHGVCAGPRAMIDEFLSVLVDGQAPRDGLPAALDPELDEAVADIGPAIDYAMLGLQAYAAVFSHWPLAMRTYEALHATATAWAQAEPTPAVHGVLAWLAPLVERLRSSTHLATEAWRADRELVYGDMDGQTQRSRTGQLPARPLGERVAAHAARPQPALEQALREATQRHFGAAATASQQHWRDTWQGHLSHYLRQAQGLLREAGAAQRQTNALLGREAPSQPFELADIDLYVQIAEETEGRVPFLPDELARVLGVRVHLDAGHIATEDMEAVA